jgi:arylsulfatase
MVVDLFGQHYAVQAGLNCLRCPELLQFRRHHEALGNLTLVFVYLPHFPLSLNILPTAPRHAKGERRLTEMKKRYEAFSGNGRTRNLWIACVLRIALIGLSLETLAAGSALAQQSGPEPCLPAATQFLNSKQLPPPPKPFGGVIKEKASDSKPCWDPKVVPPKGAPNVLLIMTDDVGFGAPSTFGGVIPTPALDRIAKMGLRFTNFHSTALCSPTRAALITGRNHHTAGFGVVSELATGYPGYNSVIEKTNGTIGEILKHNGYSTSWFGKNHNTPAYEASQAGPFDRWPIGLGFEYFYGFVGGDTNQWEPGNLFRNTTAIYPYIGHKGWNLTTAMAEDAIDYLHTLNQVAPDKPFFIYYVPGGTHAPHHPTPEWIKKISEMHLFDNGWNALRDQIFANQKKLGVIPQNAQLTPWPKDLLQEWGTLTDLQKKLYIRQADVYAAYLAYTDYEIGRVIQAIDDMGRLDNTLIIYISGDNGSSAEGTVNGTPNEVASLNGVQLPVPISMAFYPLWGSNQTYPHMAVGWTWAFDTPFKWTKQIASHFGGTRQGMAIAWPNRIKDAGGIRTQFHHMIDVMPTILEATGIPAPDTINGIKQNPIEGVSMVYTFDAANANAPSKRTTQYFEMLGNRAIYHDGWIAATTPALAPWLLSASTPPDIFTGYNWELYNVAADPTENNNLAAAMSDKLKEMQTLFYAEAKKYNVFPLDNSTLPRLLTPRPSPTAGRTVFTYSGVLSGVPTDAAPSVLQRSFKITANLDIPDGGATGMIVTQGGRFGGYGFFLSEGRKRRLFLKLAGLFLIPTVLFALLAFRASKSWAVILKLLFGASGLGVLAFLVLAFTIGVGSGKPVFLYNLFGILRTNWVGREALSPGKHTVVFDFQFDGGGWGKGGTGTLMVDGKEVDRKRIQHTVPFNFQWDDTFDVGMDTGTPVSLVDYEIPFRFTGRIDKLTFNLGPRQVPPGGEKTFEINSAENNPASE